MGQLLARHNKSIYALEAGQQQCRCAGGISFSLDLAGAFGSVPRRLLAQSFFRLGINHDVIHILMAFHHEARYWTSVAGHRTSVTTTQGIKQGCKIAPFLFVSFTVMVMEQLQQQISREWVKEGLTIFADDHCAAWKVEDRQTLKQALSGIQTVIHVLEDNGLQINAKKSAILYDLKGKDVMKEMGVYIQKTESGKCMLMQSQQGQIAIPIKNRRSTWEPCLHIVTLRTWTCSIDWERAEGSMLLSGERYMQEGTSPKPIDTECGWQES